jgi:predicted O-methyltransferase YrrM
MGPGRLGESQAPQGTTRRPGGEQDLLARIRQTRGRLVTEGPPRVRSGGDFERVCVPVSDSDVLRDLILAEKPGTVIEIGLAYGSSALAIAEALAAAGPHQARHVIVDAYQQQFHGSGWAAITGAGLTVLCSLVQERSQIALPRLLADGFTADAAFVDGSHIFHNVFVDLFYLRELVRRGGLVILDDCSYPSVATAARYFEVNTGWKPEQPGIQFLLLALQGIDDILLRPPAGLVPPAPAVRPESLADLAAPPARAAPVIPAVAAPGAFMIEEDGAPALGALSHAREPAPVAPAVLPAR